MKNWHMLVFLGVLGLAIGMGLFAGLVLPTSSGAALPVGSAPVFLATSTPRATDTPMPTPTLPDYQATEFAVRLTEVAVQATEAQAARAHELEMEKYHWLSVTGTVAVTSVAQTSTAVAVNATATQQAEVIFMARETATAYAPTQIVAAANSAAEAEFARVDMVVRVFFIGCLGWAFWMVGMVLWRNGGKTRVDDGLVARLALLEERVESSQVAGYRLQVADDDVVRVNLLEGRTGEFVTTWMFSVPCSAEMLTEFADGILSGVKTTGFEHWEGRDSLWTRKSYGKFRGWLSSNKFASVESTGMLVLNERGKGFLRGWLDGRELPGKFEFDQSFTQGLKLINPSGEIVAGEIASAAPRNDK